MYEVALVIADNCIFLTRVRSFVTYNEYCLTCNLTGAAKCVLFNVSFMAFANDSLDRNFKVPLAVFNYSDVFSSRVQGCREKRYY